MNPTAPEVIAAKRDGAELSDDQIRWVLRAYQHNEVVEEQMSALLMAVLFRGLTSRELATWTAEMIASGERLDLSGLSRPTVDKHSTGGVGDKISIVLAPLVAACGAAVPQLSGRGLGHTGGTLDKLESIPGWRAVLSNDEVVDQLEEVGAVICAAGAGMAPIDRRLYALRDVTATVESIPLISSSIMSKKIAEGTGALVLDVKVGRGAFMATREYAVELAETMVGIGEAHGVATVAQVTNMDHPLGRAAGNALEVAECLDVLTGGGPADVRELTLALAAIMLDLVGIADDPAARLDDGSAFEVYRRMIAAQGGDPDAPLPHADHVAVIEAERDGVVTDVDARGVGVAAWRLGAGRAHRDDAVDAVAGVLTLVGVGDRVAKGQPLFELHADDDAHLDLGRQAIAGALTIGEEAPPRAPLLLDRIGRAPAQ